MPNLEETCQFCALPLTYCTCADLSPDQEEALIIEPDEDTDAYFEGSFGEEICPACGETLMDCLCEDEEEPE